MINISVKPNKKHYTIIQWEVTSVCNRACSYCPEFLHDGQYRWPEFNNVTEFLLQYVNAHSDRKFVIQLIGGEPTVWPELDRFIDWCYEHSILVNIVSNGNRSPRWWKQYSSKLNKIGLSLHWEGIDLEQFESNVRAITEQQHCEVMIMAMPETFDRSVQQAEKFAKEFNNVNAQVKLCRVLFGDEYYEYSREQWNTFNSLPEYYTSPEQDESSVVWPQSARLDTSIGEMHYKEIVKKKLNQWNGYTCGAGIQTLYIDFRGEITNGACHGTSYGNINTSWTIPTSYSTCNKEWCHCAVDIKTDKYLEQ